jgi:sugar phosphate isomerase/epimerase
MIRIACSTGIRSTRSLEEACALIHELGFTRVDPLAMEGWHIKPSRLAVDAWAEADRLRALLDVYSLCCPAINLGLLHNLADASAEQHAANLDVVRGACVLAGAAEAPVLTVGTGGTAGWERGPLLERLAERLGEMVAVAGEAGQTVALETHAGSIAVYPDAARELVGRCPGLKLTYDPSHFTADQVPVEDTLDLLDHAVHAHLRNARVGHFQETMARGALDIPWIVDHMLASGYRGVVSIEYIEDCGGIEEGYEVRDEVVALREVLVDRGLVL